MRPQHLPWGGGGGEGEKAAEEGKLKEVCGVGKKNIYRISYILLPAQQNILMNTELLAFMESVDSSREAVFAFGLSALISTNIY